MPRPNFQVALLGSIKTEANGIPATTKVVTNAKYSGEIVSGTARRKPSGWVPPTGYSLHRYEVTRAIGSSHVQVYGGNWSKYDGCIGGDYGRFNSLNHFDEAVTNDIANTPLDHNAALMAARNKLKSANVDLGVAFAERKATSRMLGDTARRIARAAVATQRGQFRAAARHLGIIHDVKKPRGSNWTNHWLQLQYGWKPLLSDVYGSCEALSKLDRSDWRVTVKAQRRDRTNYWVKRSPQGSAYPSGNFDAMSCGAERNRGVFVRIDAIPENDLTMSLASLGILNPLLVAWELVPYSFVVDWALPIGAWLDSLDALVGYGPAWTSITTYNNTLWEENGVSKEFSSTAWVRNKFKGTKRQLKVIRTASSGVPLAAFPRFKDPRSLGHMANGLSLLAQAFGRR